MRPEKKRNSACRAGGRRHALSGTTMHSARSSVNREVESSSRSVRPAARRGAWARVSPAVLRSAPTSRSPAGTSLVTLVTPARACRVSPAPTCGRPTPARHSSTMAAATRPPTRHPPTRPTPRSHGSHPGRTARTEVARLVPRSHVMHRSRTARTQITPFAPRSHGHAVPTPLARRSGASGRPRERSGDLVGVPPTSGRDGRLVRGVAGLVADRRRSGRWPSQVWSLTVAGLVAGRGRDHGRLSGSLVSLSRP